MIVMGISEGYHDAGVTVLNDTEIVTASHSERYSRIKNDKWAAPEQLQVKADHTIAYYEDPELKNDRRKFAGQSAVDCKTDYDVCYPHHMTHAAAGYYTAPFDDCNIIVVDAIGEFETITIWDNMTMIKSWEYPYSLGLLYSAVTKRIGYKPNCDEYITMAMAASGEPIYDMEPLLDKNNHKGIPLPWMLSARPENLAASVQQLYEKKLLELVALCPKENLILMGGCALNCVANSKIKGKNIWIMPSPGDAGSSLGAAALVQKKKLNWTDPYLGYNIDREVNPREVVDQLLKAPTGVANGRAEFGPRALGNRSLLADPRKDVKEVVNTIKQREQFRPFAPAILEEYSKEYFSGPMNRYMQFVAKAHHDYKSVTHIDGTARVQVVEYNCTSILRLILEEWYERTGCPMLLNTSLNIKGQPIVNNEKDAEAFSKEYGVKVF
jgi:carbamoyltransferase